MSVISQLNTMTGFMGLGVWTVIEKKGCLQHDWADLYEDKYGKWNHSNGYTLQHNRLGESWAWWAIEHAGFKNVTLTDSPDIRADIDSRRLIGDVGQCTYMAWMDGAGCLGFHDLWVSVLDYDTQVIIEPHAHIGLFRSAKIALLLEGKHDDDAEIRERYVRDIFFCPKCKIYHYDPDVVRGWLNEWIDEKID